MSLSSSFSHPPSPPSLLPYLPCWLPGSTTVTMRCHTSQFTVSAGNNHRLFFLSKNSNVTCTRVCVCVHGIIRGVREVNMYCIVETFEGENFHEFQGFIAIQESFLREFSWKAHKWAICKSFLHKNYIFFRQYFLLYGRGERVCERSHAVFGRLQLKSTESEGLENLIMVVMLWCQVDRRGIDIWESGHPLSYLFEVAKNEVTWFYSLVTVATWFYSLVTLPDLVVPCWHRDEENPSICCVTHWSRSGEVQRT